MMTAALLCLPPTEDSQLSPHIFWAKKTLCHRVKDYKLLGFLNVISDHPTNYAPLSLQTLSHRSGANLDRSRGVLLW